MTAVSVSGRGLHPRAPGAQAPLKARGPLTKQGVRSAAMAAGKSMRASSRPSASPSASSARASRVEGRSSTPRSRHAHRPPIAAIRRADARVRSDTRGCIQILWQSLTASGCRDSTCSKRARIIAAQHAGRAEPWVRKPDKASHQPRARHAASAISSTICEGCARVRAKADSRTRPRTAADRPEMKRVHGQPQPP